MWTYLIFLNAKEQCLHGTLARRTLYMYISNTAFENSRDNFELEQKSLFHKGGQFEFRQKKM